MRHHKPSLDGHSTVDASARTVCSQPRLQGWRGTTLRAELRITLARLILSLNSSRVGNCICIFAARCTVMETRYIFQASTHHRLYHQWPAHHPRAKRTDSAHRLHHTLGLIHCFVSRRTVLQLQNINTGKHEVDAFNHTRLACQNFSGVPIAESPWSIQCHLDDWATL
jgi:hypothetical protein